MLWLKYFCTRFKIIIVIYYKHTQTKTQNAQYYNYVCHTIHDIVVQHVIIAMTSYCHTHY